MKKYLKKSLADGYTIEAITFDELVEYGKQQEHANIVDGMPWHFSFKGLSVTHENNDMYIVNTTTFNRGQILAITKEDEIVIYDQDYFNNNFIEL